MKPFSKAQLEQIKEYYRIGLTYTSNAIEGNTLTESEIKVVLEDGMTVDGKPLKYHFEAVGHSDAYSFMYSLIHQKGFDEKIIKRLHHLFWFRVKEDQAGVYRTEQVLIGGSQYPVAPFAELPKLMEQFVLEYGQRDPGMHPVEYAARVHKEFVFIHPFFDGNGRISRLLMNLVLLQEGYQIVIIPPVTRATYYKALEKAHVDDSEFINFIGEMVKESQRDFIRLFHIQ